MIRLLSLGAGVQSSTLALLCEAGAWPKPDAAIFADTGAEPAAVYEWLNWLEAQLSFPVHRVSNGNLRENMRESIEGERFAGVPLYTEPDEVTGDGRRGVLRRQCTSEFKLRPMMIKARELAGLKPRQRSKGIAAEFWIGISLDEAQRMKPARNKWARNRWPLIELEMHRHDCINWMQRQGYPTPPRSACTFCPYHANGEWRRMKDHDPESWRDAVEMDRIIRQGVRGTTKQCYLHPSLQPLEEVDLSNAEDYGQVDAFGNECEGMCGV